MQAIVALPLVLPPTVLGFYLLVGLGPLTSIGQTITRLLGHPLAYLPLPTSTREAYAAQHNLDPAKPWIALLPGSRWRELTANLPTMVEMARLHPRDCEYILPVATTIGPERLREFVSGWITFEPPLASMTPPNATVWFVSGMVSWMVPRFDTAPPPP